MIGQVKLPNGTVAVLGDDGVWTCDDDFVAMGFNDMFNPHDGGGLRGLYPFGYEVINEAAVASGGTAEHAQELPPLPPGAVS